MQDDVNNDIKIQGLVIIDRNILKPIMFLILLADSAWISSFLFSNSKLSLADFDNSRGFSLLM